MAKTAEQYLQENEDLRIRLLEAEETLEAIRSGQVDAIVVTQGQQEQVFTLQGAEHAYRIILERMSEGAAMLAADGTLVYCNARLAEVLDKPMDQMLGGPIEPYVLPADRLVFRSLFRQALETESRGEVRFQGRNGSPVPVYLSLNPLALGQAGSVCMVATDLTERRRSEEVLASEQFVRRLIDNAPVGVAVVGQDLRYILANPAYQSMAGDRDRPLAGRVIAEVLPPAVAQIVESFVKRVLDSGEPLEVQDYEAPLRGRTWWNVNQIPLRNGHGHTEAVLILTQEVTERKRAEEALRESEKRYRLLVDRNPDGVFAIDAGGRITWANPACESISGYAVAELLQKTFIEVLAADELPKAFSYFDRCLREATYQQLETALIHKDGRRVEIWVAGEPILSSGQVVAVHCTAKDITERKRAEEQLKEWSQTLEQRVVERTAEVEHRVGQLRAMTTELTLAEHRERQRIAKVLHDHLQQLLVGAKFHVSSIQRQIADPQVNRSLDQIGGLLDESVQASRSLTAELFPPALREGTFAQALRWLIQWMRDKHDLQVHFRADEQANPQAEEIRLLLFEAARELLFNVVKHAGVREACLEAIRHSGDQMRLTVADSGRGFDVASVSPTDRSDGGFGLSTIRERLHLLGGHVEIESVPGQGTRATLVAPLRL